MARSGKSKKKDENKYNSDLGSPREKPIGALNSGWIGEGAMPTNFPIFFSKLAGVYTIDFAQALGGGTIIKERIRGDDNQRKKKRGKGN